MLGLSSRARSRPARAFHDHGLSGLDAGRQEIAALQRLGGINGDALEFARRFLRISPGLVLAIDQGIGRDHHASHRGADRHFDRDMLVLGEVAAFHQHIKAAAGKGRIETAPEDLETGDRGPGIAFE